MSDATVRANAQAMPKNGPLSGDALATELLDVVDWLAKVRRILSAAAILIEEIELAEREPLATVLGLAEDELNAAIARLDALRPRPHDREAA